MPRRRLELVAHELAPANRVDVWGLVIHPLVKLIFPAIEMDEQQAAHTTLDSGCTHEARLHQVHGLQFHVGREAVTWVVLKKHGSLRNVNTLKGGFQVANTDMNEHF